MKKRILNMMLCAVLAAAMIASVAACGSAPGKESTPGTGTQPEKTEVAPAKTEPAGTAAEQPEKLVEVTDKDGKRLGAIDANSSCTAVDGGIFYSVLEIAEYAPTGTAYYHFFRAADGKDILFGSLENWGYEAAYARTELGGVIYTLALEGNAFDSDPDTLWLLACDPAAGTMTKHTVSRDGFAYSAMAAANGKLLIMNHELNAAKSDKIYEFDPASGTVREVLSFPDDGKASLRSVAAAEDGFYLLRLGLSGGMPKELFLDRYDSAYKLTDSLSLNSLIMPAAKELPGFEGEADVLNEFGMSVGGFAVQDGKYFFYENFGRIRVTVDLQTGEVLFANEDLWSMAHGAGEPSFYEIAFEAYGAGEGPKIITVKDGKAEALPFRPADGSFFLQSASRAADGTWLMCLTSAAGEAKLCLWQEK